MKSSPKMAAKSIKCAKPCKDWHGAHWHTVGWLAAIAIVLSASTMSLSVSAASAPASPSASVRDISELKAQLSRIESKIDRLAPSAPSADKAN